MKLQIYINPEKPGDQLETYVAEQLAELRAGKIPAGGLGLLPSSFDRAPARTVDGTFGTGFSTKIDALPAGEWQGPIESGLGLHLIRLESREEDTVPDLAEIRPVVGREWANERRIENRRKINQALLENYDVVIEWPGGETEEEIADLGAAP